MISRRTTQFRIAHFRVARIALALTVLSTLFNCGCQGLCCWTPPWKRSSVTVRSPAPVPAYSVFVSPEFRSRPPQRVVLLPSGQSPGNYQLHRRAIQELATQLRQIGAFEIVVPRDERFGSHSDNLLQGSFDEREIAEFSDYYNADAIAIVRVNELRPVAPLRTSITMVIVDANESIVTFAVDGVWDTGNQGTYQGFQSYIHDHQALTGLANSTSGNQPPIELQSPTALFSFATSQVAGAVQMAAP